MIWKNCCSGLPEVNGNGFPGSLEEKLFRSIRICMTLEFKVLEVGINLLWFSLRSAELHCGIVVT